MTWLFRSCTSDYLTIGCAWNYIYTRWFFVLTIATYVCESRESTCNPIARCLHAYQAFVCTYIRVWAQYCAPPRCVYECNAAYTRACSAANCCINIELYEAYFATARCAALCKHRLRWICDAYTYDRARGTYRVGTYAVLKSPNAPYRTGSWVTLAYAKCTNRARDTFLVQGDTCM